MTRRDQTPPPVIARRLNGLALTQQASDALNEIQGAEDLTATDAINRAIQLYNTLRKERETQFVLLEDRNSGTQTRMEWT